MRMRHGQITIRSQTVSSLAPYSYRAQINGISVCGAEGTLRESPSDRYENPLRPKA